MENSVEDLRSRFIEQIGVVAQAEGMPRISGRIVGLLVFDGRPYSFSELASQLQVSRGSISGNVRALEDRGVIERIAKPGDRQDYFQLGENPYAKILHGVVQRASKTSASIRKVADALPSSLPETVSRLENYASFYESVADGIRVAADKMDD